MKMSREIHTGIELHVHTHIHTHTHRTAAEHSDRSWLLRSRTLASNTYTKWSTRAYSPTYIHTQNGCRALKQIVSITKQNSRFKYIHEINCTCILTYIHTDTERLQSTQADRDYYEAEPSLQMHIRNELHIHTYMHTCINTNKQTRDGCRGLKQSDCYRVAKTHKRATNWVFATLY